MDWDFGTAWGLAFGIYNINGRTLTGHAGSCPGFNTRVYIDPITKTGAAVMANRNNANVNTYAQTILNILEAGGTPEPAEASEDLADYAGSYDYHPWGGEALVFKWNNGLALTWLPTNDPLADMEELERIDGDLFRMTRKDGEPGQTIRFERDSEGKVEKMWQHSMFARRIN